LTLFVSFYHQTGPEEERQKNEMGTHTSHKERLQTAQEQKLHNNQQQQKSLGFSFFNLL